MFAAVVTAGFGLFGSYRSAKEARKQPFLQRQLEYCFQAADTVAILATTSDKKLWEQSRDRFWHLYYGAFAVVEGRDVENCMVACSRFIPPTGEAPRCPSARCAIRH